MNEAPETQHIIEERDRMVVSHGLRLVRARRHREADGMGKYDSLAALRKEKLREDRLRELERR